MRKSPNAFISRKVSIDDWRAIRGGFALVSTLVLMVLLTLIAVGLLSLSTIVLRASSAERDMATARANARLALMVALGNLQESMGPDTRISAFASILDSDPSTPTVEGVKNPHLLGVWESWGGWLNAEAEDPSGSKINIAATYTAGREKMFRKWLVSTDLNEMSDLEFGKTGDLEQASSAAQGADSVVLVGENSVFDAKDYVWAKLMPIRDENKLTGRMAWWVGGENQKADVTRNIARPSQSPGTTELAHGDGTLRDLSELDGLSGVSRDEETASKLVSVATLRHAGADETAIAQGFHNYTAHSLGLLTDTRWGGVKTDLSLLFEKSTLPSRYSRNNTHAFSPRPLSQDLSLLNPRIKERGFTSFEQMHAFARQYKSNIWSGSRPIAQTAAFSNNDNKSEPEGFYRRMPVIAKFYSVYNLQVEKKGKNDKQQDLYDCYLTYSPVVQLWNPFNIPLRLDKQYQVHTLPYKVMPIRFKTYKDGKPFTEFQHMDYWVGADQGGYANHGLGADDASPFQEANGNNVLLAPGEFKIFSFKNDHHDGLASQEPLRPGFNPVGVGAARLKVLADVTRDDKPSVALQIQPYWVAANAQWFGGNPGGFSNLITYNSHTHTGSGLNIDWFAEPDRPPSSAPERSRQDYASISPDAPVSARAQWEFADEEPIPVAVMGAVLKTHEARPYYTVSWARDWRNKTWAHSSPGIDAEHMLANYTPNGQILDSQRLTSAYQMYFGPVSGSAELSELIGHNGEQGYFGGALDAPISSISTYELPTAPVQSLAGFSGLRLQPGWFSWESRQVESTQNVNAQWPNKIVAYKSGVPGLGVGNSFASPMIAGNRVYQYHDISKNNPNSQIVGSGAAQDSMAFSDFWDHQLLVNDGLWDSYYCSSLMDGKRPSDSTGSAVSNLLQQFFKDGSSLPNTNYEPLGGVSPDDAISDLQAADGYLRSAMYLGNRGAFNVNSVSVDAWYALFTGLREHRAVYREQNGQLREIQVPSGMGLVTRYNTETAGVETADPRVGALVNGVSAWTGVRFLSDQQLRKLAEECVKQVKLRGPFLNMSDFINRRLVNNHELATKGALQAAIDYDDSNPDPNSINYRFKRSEDMVPAGNAGRLSTFRMAAEGSMFTGAPGYVVQSDILKPLGNSLTVRDDSFKIRTCGEAVRVDGNGKVTILARAYCEAIVQRTIDYVDPSNDSITPAVPLDEKGNITGTSELTELNRRFGRRFKIVSFRWLSSNEV